jgi:hypothetical protein
MRVQVAEANVINLNPLNIAAPVIGTDLFQGHFMTKSLIWGFLLEITMKGDGVEADPTAASLGWMTIKSSREGDFPRLPLYFLYQALPFLGVPCYTEVLAPVNGIRVTIPIPFALIKGVRPKDTYLVSEKCEDFFLEFHGTQEGAVVYTEYSILPILIAEANRNVCLPSMGNIRYASDDIPANVDYKSKMFVQGASWAILAKSDYTDFARTDRFKLIVDGKTMQTVSTIMRESRVFSAVNQSRYEYLGADVVPDNFVILPLSLDKKMAKISRNSQQIMEFHSTTSWTVHALYQPFEPLNESESLNLAQRQNTDIVITPEILPAPVGMTGRIQLGAKPIYRKFIAVDPNADSIDEGLRGRIANTR